MNRLALILASFLVLLMHMTSAHAGTCVRDASNCLDATPCKTIAGETICLADMGETCWKYRDDFTCVKVGAELECQPLMDQMPACWQTNSTCVQTDPLDGSCFIHEQSWQCQNWQMATPPDVTRLDDTINYVRNALNESSCDAFKECTLVSQTCIEGAETRSISGIDIHKSCWKWDRQYSCSSASDAACIANRSDPTCTETSSVCASLNPDSSCAVYNRTFTCSSNTIDAGGADALCGSSTAPCTTETITLPPETWTDGCQETIEANPETCTLTRDVQVDRDYLYQCNSSNNKVENQACQKLLTVEVTFDTSANCIPGTQIASATLSPYTVNLGGFFAYEGQTVRLYCTAIIGQYRVTHQPQSYSSYWETTQFQNTTQRTNNFSISGTYTSAYFESTITCQDGGTSCTWSGKAGQATSSTTYDPVGATTRLLASTPFIGSAPPIPIETDTWVDQCVALDARTN